VSDGRGGWRPCRFGAELEPTAGVSTEPRPSPPVTIAFALTKGEKPDWAVQKLTELGVDTIVAFTAARSIVRWAPDRAATHVERWRRIAREAAMQSRRVWLPELAPVTDFATMVAAANVCLAHPGGDPPSLDRPAILVGPEGGWAEEELAAGLPRVALGPHVLRAETAAMAAGALLCALRAGLVGRFGHFPSLP
jgi:16S rRNA (uracil1498-N3)-methyltransferase